MFYFDYHNENKVLKSTLLDGISGVTAFFTLRDAGKPQIGVAPEQTHSSNIEFVDERISYPNTDGLILTKSGQACYLKFADCTPLIFYNPITKIGAVSHAGWRGTAAKIGIKTLEKMGGNPQDTIVLVGTAIGMCCYEVSEEVKEQLLSTVKDTVGLFEGRNVDLKSINARQLKEAGVKHIDVSPYCTSCDNELFYSYRKENGTSNRHYAFLCLSSC